MDGEVSIYAISPHQESSGTGPAWHRPGPALNGMAWLGKAGQGMAHFGIGTAQSRKCRAMLRRCDAERHCVRCGLPGLEGLIVRNLADYEDVSPPDRMSIRHLRTHTHTHTHTHARTHAHTHTLTHAHAHTISGVGTYTALPLPCSVPCTRCLGSPSTPSVPLECHRWLRDYSRWPCLTIIGVHVVYRYTYTDI